MTVVLSINAQKSGGSDGIYPRHTAELHLCDSWGAECELKQYRETKNITPRTDRCGVKGKLNAEQILILGELIEVNNDATLEELRPILYGKIGFSLSISTIARMIKLLDITVKKKLSSLQAKAPTEFNSCDVSSGKKLKRLV